MLISGKVKRYLLNSVLHVSAAKNDITPLNLFSACNVIFLPFSRMVVVFQCPSNVK